MRDTTEISMKILIAADLCARGHGDCVNLVLGSVATKVLALCATPVLLVGQRHGCHLRGRDDSSARRFRSGLHHPV